MRRSTKTKPTMALAELAEKGADADVLRQKIQFVAQRMMEIGVEGMCAAAYGERNPERANSRNGSRPHRDAVGDRVGQEVLHRLVFEGQFGEAWGSASRCSRPWRSRKRPTRLAMRLASAVSSAPVGAFTQRKESAPSRPPTYTPSRSSSRDATAPPSA